jgi:hypothetical protein
MKLYCIDDNFTEEQKSVLKNCPIEGEEYTLRQERICSSGRRGFYLNEIVNPPIHFKKSFNEPSFSIDRFVVLGGPMEEIILEKLKNK